MSAKEKKNYCRVASVINAGPIT